MKKSLKFIFCIALFFMSFQTYAQTFEGNGAASPEEAVAEYINALKDCDYEKIINCYAVETYVKNYNIESLIERLKCSSPTMKMIYPKDNLLVQTAKYEVLDSITKLVKGQIWNLSGNSFLLDANVLWLNENMEEVMEATFPENPEEKLSGIEFANEFVPVECFLLFKYTLDVSELEDYREEIDYMLERIEPKYEMLKQNYGCNEIQDVVAVLSVEGKKYFYVAETIEYGSRWYVSPNQSMLSMLLNASVYSGGIIACEDLDP